MKKSVKIFSCVIVVISFILLFFSWVELTPDAKKASVSVYNSTVSSDQQIKSFSQLGRVVKRIDFDNLLGLDDEELPLDISVNAFYKSSGIKKAINSITDGGLNTTEIANVSLTGSRFYKYFESFGSLLNSVSGRTLTDSAGRSAAMSVFGIIMTIVLIISILAAIFTFFVRLFDRFDKYRKYDLIFFIAQLVLLVLSIVFAGSANSLVSSFPLFGITAWAIIAVILACPSILIDKLPFAKLERYTGRGTAANETFNKVSDSFSEAVGKISDKVGETQNNVRLGQELKSNEESLNEKYQILGKKYYEENELEPPEGHIEEFNEIKDNKEQIEHIQKNLDVSRNVVACPECGTKWRSGVAYCGNCGTKLPEIEEDERRPRREKIENEFCKYCGAKVESSDAFCPACGKSL